MAGGGGDPDDPAAAFDLTALMDILSNIIFFLMASFGAAVVAIVPASVPTISEGGENDAARDEDRVTVTLKLSADGKASISAANQDMLPEELEPYDKSFSPKDGTIDAQAVNDHLWSIKDKFRKSKDIVIVCDDDVTYQMLVEAMDASRERKVMVNGEATYPSLFPAAVVSSMAK